MFSTIFILRPGVENRFKCYMGRAKRICYLSPMRAAKVQASLRIRAVSPEPSLLAHTSSEWRGTFRQKAKSLAPLNGWACAVKICHDGMLEDTNSLDGAHIMLLDLWGNWSSITTAYFIHLITETALKKGYHTSLHRCCQLVGFFSIPIEKKNWNRKIRHIAVFCHLRIELSPFSPKSNVTRKELYIWACLFRHFWTSKGRPLYKTGGQNYFVSPLVAMFPGRKSASAKRV